jgi:Cytochrome oxidase maturation protein cbb3-type
VAGQLFLLLAAAGDYLLVAAFVLLVYRLGRFKASNVEKRTSLILVVVVVVWSVFLVFVRPPGQVMLPISLAFQAVFWGAFVWAWRTGRFGIERVPEARREEVMRRRQWMRAHVPLLISLVIVLLVLTAAWPLAVVLIFMPRQ